VVSVRENRSEVVLAPVGEPTTGPAQGWVSCPVRVDQAGAVDGWPNLLGGATGRRMTALLPPNAAALLEAGNTWRVRAELVRPGVLRVSDDPAELAVLPP